MMKNHLLFSICILLSTLAYSQNNISFGVKTGINSAHATGEASNSNSEIDYDKGRTAFHAGIISELSLSEKFSLQSELVYSQVGASYFYDARPSDGPRVNSDLNLDYITLPILAKYSVFGGLSLEVGPQIAYVIKSEIENETASFPMFGGNEMVSIDETIDIKEDVNNFDFGLAFGASYELNNGFLLQARYVLGLTEVFKNKNYTTSTDLKNGVFQVSLGFKF